MMRKSNNIFRIITNPNPKIVNNTSSNPITTDCAKSKSTLKNPILKKKQPHPYQVGYLLLFINRSNNIVNRSNDLFIVYIISVISEAI